MSRPPALGELHSHVLCGPHSVAPTVDWELLLQDDCCTSVLLLLLEKEDSSSNLYWNCAIHPLVSHYNTFKIMYFKITTAPSTVLASVECWRKC